MKNPLPDNYSPAMIALMAAFIFLASFGIASSVMRDLQEPAQRVFVD